MHITFLPLEKLCKNVYQLSGMVVMTQNVRRVQGIRMLQFISRTV